MNLNIIFGAMLAIVIIILIIITQAYYEPPHIIVHINEMVGPAVGGNPAAQNVHDTNVRRALWQKYYLMKEEIHNRRASDGPKWLTNIIERVKSEIPIIFKEIPKILALFEEIKKANTITAIEFTENELEVFALVWEEYRYRKLPMDTFRDQLLDCYEGETLVCITGRISRYIGVFEGIVNDFLGQSELTEEMLFIEATREGKKILDDYLDKNPEIKKIYLEGGSLEEEKKLEEFFNIIKPRAHNRLANLYSSIKHKIPEIIEGY